MCEACAAKSGVTEAPILNLMEIMTGVKPDADTPAPAGTEIACPECGLTESEFKKTARFGCAHCYDLFSDNLKALLPRIQAGVTHGGKHPCGARIHAARAELSRKRDELQKAVNTENYELAASLRDAVAVLEKEIEALGKSEKI